MRDQRARQILMAEARRLGLLHRAIVDDIAAGQSELPAASDTRSATAGAVTLEHEIEESLRMAIGEERAEVAIALARIDAGTYGRCVSCGDMVPDDRLEAVPATRFCIACEAVGERSDGSATLPMLDTILRAALREVDRWDDDAPTADPEDDLLLPPPEPSALHPL